MSEVTTDQAYQMAVEHHQAGRLAEAEDLYRKILKVSPKHPGAYHSLGIIASQCGQNDHAVVCIKISLQYKPNWPEAWNNLGKVYRDLGRLDDAITALRQAIGFRPDYPEAHLNLAIALQDNGFFDLARQEYLETLRLRPNYPEVLMNLGNLQRQRGDCDSALSYFRQAVALRPDYIDALINLGNLLRETGQIEESLAVYIRLQQLQPKSPDIALHFGNLLAQKGDLDSAMAAFAVALELRPQFPGALLNLGNAWRSKEDFEAATAAYRKALVIQADFGEAWNNLGDTYKDLGRLDESVETFRRGVAARPNMPALHSALIFTLHYHPKTTPQVIFDECRRWNELHALPVRSSARIYANTKEPERPLRIGYLSADFRDHACAHFFYPLLSNQDRSRFQIFCYADVIQPDAITRRMQPHAEGWVFTPGMSDHNLAQRIRDDRIDILVELSRHTAGNRLTVMARQPAPVQLSWLGNLSTTGLGTIDYRITDRFIDPPGLDDAFYSEPSLYLPDCVWNYDPLVEGPAVNDLPALSSGRITFGSLNTFCKLNDEVLKTWARLLKSIENSQMVMLVPLETNARTAGDFLASLGVRRDRIRFVRKAPRLQYLELHHQIDIALDPFPCCGHTTSFDSLWMGVPFVTFPGPTAVGRHGFMQLKILGMPELIATSPDEYLRLLTELATDLPRLAELRRTLRLRLQNSVFMDGPRFARNMEGIYRDVWKRWCTARP